MLTAKLVLALALINTPAPTPAEPAPMPAEARLTVERGLGFLEQQGIAWLDKRKCIGCHHGAWMVWGHNEALGKGFAVDRAKVDAWTGRVLTMYWGTACATIGLVRTLPSRLPATGEQ